MPYVSKNRRKKRGPIVSRKAQNIGLLTLVILVILAVAWALIPRPSAQPVADDDYVPPQHSVSQKRAAPPATVADVTERLKSSDDPVTITVIGDSTGYGPEAWVELVATEIAAQTDRRADIHDWDDKAQEYKEPRYVGSGDRTLTVWNASAPGKSALYASEHFKDMLTEKSDMVLINHGHNTYAAKNAKAQIERLINMVRRGASGKAAIGVMTQNPSTNGLEERQDPVVRAVRAAGEANKTVTVFDIYAAFKDAGNVDALIREDGIHPSPEGYRLWADTILKQMGF